jgi:hypothetical protein
MLSYATPNGPGQQSRASFRGQENKAIFLAGPRGFRLEYLGELRRMPACVY